jgi:hypothetical protein
MSERDIAHGTGPPGSGPPPDGERNAGPLPLEEADELVPVPRVILELMEEWGEAWLRTLLFLILKDWTDPGLHWPLDLIARGAGLGDRRAARALGALIEHGWAIEADGQYRSAITLPREPWADYEQEGEPPPEAPPGAAGA